MVWALFYRKGKGKGKQFQRAVTIRLHLLSPEHFKKDVAQPLKRICYMNLSWWRHDDVIVPRSLLWRVGTLLCCPLVGEAYSGSYSRKRTSRAGRVFCVTHSYTLRTYIRKVYIVYRLKTHRLYVRLGSVCIYEYLVVILRCACACVERNTQSLYYINRYIRTDTHKYVY